MPDANFWERLKTRIRTELGGGPTPAPAEPRKDEGADPGFIERLKNRLKTLAPGRPKEPPPAPPPSGVEGILYRIREAGRKRTLILMRYHDVWRHVEPYSFRYRGRNKSLRFFGYCRLHGHIEMFIPSKIQGLVVTDLPFYPRWPVELN